MARILVLFHSTGGRTWRMAEAVAEGVAAVPGAEPVLKQVPEIAEAPFIQGPDWAARRAAFAHVPAADPAELADYDGLALGTPVHFGAASAALRVFLDRTGQAWMQGALIGKPATVFCGAGSGGGREAAILSLWALLGTHGMTILPLGLGARELAGFAAPHGGSPFGAGTLAAAPGERPSAAERAMARAQGRALADVARRLAAPAR
jgi:NAD(P)H dehydrogenase (quinone)